MDFRDKKILITGGSAGIGLAMGEVFATRGARIALLARHEEALCAAANVVSRRGHAPVTVSADICDGAALAVAVAAAAEGLGARDGLDGVVVNAGYCHPGRFLETSLLDLQNQVNTNLVGTINTLHTVLPTLKRGGFVAITSSPAGLLPIYGFAAYSATKAGIIALGDSLRLELAPLGISLHLLLPPDTDTPGYEKEVALYPLETKAILAGGALLQPQVVAEAFVAGIARGKYRVVVGMEARLALLLQRIAPWAWRRYVAGRIRSIRGR